MYLTEPVGAVAWRRRVSLAIESTHVSLLKSALKCNKVTGHDILADNSTNSKLMPYR